MISLLSLVLAATAAEPTQAFAVIVANNQSADGSLVALRYADDDGARYQELLSLVTERATLLSVLDPDTQRLHPGAAAKARAPTRAELEDVLESTFRAIALAKEAGSRTVFYFVYAGHGSVGGDGQGEMHLLDGRFSRADLFQRVLARSPATINHLIIDACNAYLLVARRGNARASEAEVDAALKGFLGKETLDRYPNTGVLLSTSKATEVHEWQRYAAGIFSHEVRSGLAGAADVDRDGSVRYDELSGFLSAANGRVPDPRARLDVHVRAPAIHLDEPLFDRSSAKSAPIVAIPADRGGRAYLEDQRGVRYADFNLAPDGPIEMTLVPAELYFLRSETKEVRIPLAGVGRVDVGTLEEQPIVLAARGSEDLTFQQYLFAVPFGAAYFEGYRASTPDAEVELVAPNDVDGNPALQVTGIVTGATGIAALAAAIAFQVAAASDAEGYRTGIGARADLEALRSSSESKATTAGILFGTGAGLAVTGAVLWWLGD